MTASATTLRIVAGKGGVGRSTVAAALAKAAVSEGKRVLAVDAIGSGGLATVVAGAGLAGQFELLRLTTSSSLDEYLKLYLKLPLGPSRLRPLARIFDYVSSAAPGVRELLIIGKIGYEVRDGGWDEVVVDAPATGHVIELLTAPQSLSSIITTGPLAQQTDWLGDVLAAETTSIALVAVPEELPISETAELLERVRSETDTRVAGLVLNRMPCAVDDAGIQEIQSLIEEESPLAGAASLAASRADNARLHTAAAAKLLLPTVIVPERASAPVAAVAEMIGASDVFR